MKSKAPGRPVSLVHDRVLSQRLEACLEVPSLRDFDDIVEYMRNAFPEYKRQKLGPFKMQLSRCNDALAVRRPELFQDAHEDDIGAEERSEGGGAVVSSLSRSMLQLYSRSDAGRDTVENEHAATPSKQNGPAEATSEIPAGLRALEATKTSDGGLSEDVVRGNQPNKRSSSQAPRCDEGIFPIGSRGPRVFGGFHSVANLTACYLRRTSAKKARHLSSRIGTSVAAPKSVWYSDLGGLESVLESIKELIEYPLKHPEVYSWLGIEPPRGVLLHGPPGCGKTALANAIANECGVPFLRVSAPEVVSGMSGESEAKIRSLFQEAASVAPCIVFIDEIDAIAPKRESAQREMERRIVAQLLTCMDDLSGLSAKGSSVEVAEEDSAGGSEDAKHVIVIGATNRPDSIDSALRRAGRFDREIAMGIPSESARTRILQVISQRVRLEGSFDFAMVARKTPGFVGADLTALMKEAAALAVQRIFRQLEEREREFGMQEDGGQPASDAVEASKSSARLGRGTLTSKELSGLAVTMSDVEGAVEKVQPSVRREGFATTPNTSWEDVGSLDEIREELEFAVIKPISHPELFSMMGLQRGSGVLLFGPPGCGKTLVAKAAANASGANFISIKGPELLNKYVGESERAVRQLFARARAASPCVLFFDELDALAPRRGSESNQSGERLVNQLLTEMDGVDGRAGVFLIAATNRPDIIDPALLRPGRLDKVLYVPLPGPAERASILKALARSVPLGPSVELDAIGRDEALDGFSGADLSALLREASVLALKESIATAGNSRVPALVPTVSQEHLRGARSRVQASVSRRDQQMYQRLRDRLRSSRGHLIAEEGTTA